MGDHVEVREMGAKGDATVYEVLVGTGADVTVHEVTVRESDRLRLAGSADGARLVSWAFAFLLAREGKESILSRFDVSVISKYFPEFEREAKHAFSNP